MTQPIPRGAADRACALFSDLIEGRWEKVDAEFDASYPRPRQPEQRRRQLEQGIRRGGFIVRNPEIDRFMRHSALAGHRVAQCQLDTVTACLADEALVPGGGIRADRRRSGRRRT